MHHLTGDAGDRAGSLDDDEQRAAGAARSALALLAPLCGGGWVGWVWDGRPRSRAAQGDALTCYGDRLVSRVAFFVLRVAAHRALREAR